MEVVKLLTENNVILFLLLFARFSGLMAFFPFFSNMAIAVSVKTAFAFFLTIIFFPMAKLSGNFLDVSSFAFAIVSELLLGFIAALALQIVFAALSLAGEQISMVMGFSMATILDPQTGVNSTIISRFLTFLGVLIILAFDIHHYMIIFISKTIGSITLGEFYPQKFVFRYLIEAVKNMFIFGFILSFPIIALSLLSDLIFGMLMKTMPQFNLLVIGFPIKIFFSFAILMAILGSMMMLFKKEFLKAFLFLNALLG